MKKILLGLITAFSLSNADVIGFSAGVGVWQENISGYIKTGSSINYLNNKSAETDGNSNTGNLGLSDNSQPYFWLKVIHPLPIIPNIKFQYTKYSTSGTGIASGNFKVFGQEITANDKVHTDLTIDSYDTTLFYEIKPKLVELEAGLGVNVFDGDAKVKSLTTNTTSSASFVAPIPYLYLSAQTMEFSSFSLSAQAKYLNLSIGHYYDYQGALNYHLATAIVDIMASIGYKSQDILGKNGDDETNIKFKGAFAQLGVRW